MKTFSIKSADIKRNWHIVDAQGEVLGRLATRIASLLRGKHKAEYTPHMDTGDHIVVINVEKIRVTGNKAKGKLYHRHTGYPGGLKSVSFEKLQAKMPERVIYLAVKGMLPRNPLGRSMLKKLKIYVGDQHPHSAQQPTMLTTAAVA